MSESKLNPNLKQSMNVNQFLQKETNQNDQFRMMKNNLSQSTNLNNNRFSFQPNQSPKDKDNTNLGTQSLDLSSSSQSIQTERQSLELKLKNKVIHLNKSSIDESLDEYKENSLINDVFEVTDSKNNDKILIQQLSQLLIDDVNNNNNSFSNNKSNRKDRNDYMIINKNQKQFNQQSQQQLKLQQDQGNQVQKLSHSPIRNEQNLKNLDINNINQDIYDNISEMQNQINNYIQEIKKIKTQLNGLSQYDKSSKKEHLKVQIKNYEQIILQSQKLYNLSIDNKNMCDYIKANSEISKNFDEFKYQIEEKLTKQLIQLQQFKNFSQSQKEQYFENQIQEQQSKFNHEKTKNSQFQQNFINLSSTLEEIKHYKQLLNSEILEINEKKKEVLIKKSELEKDQEKYFNFTNINSKQNSNNSKLKKTPNLNINPQKDIQVKIENSNQYSNEINIESNKQSPQINVLNDKQTENKDYFIFNNSKDNKQQVNTVSVDLTLLKKQKLDNYDHNDDSYSLVSQIQNQNHNYQSSLLITAQKLKQSKSQMNMKVQEQSLNQNNIQKTAQKQQKQSINNINSNNILNIIKSEEGNDINRSHDENYTNISTNMSDNSRFLKVNSSKQFLINKN